MVNENLPVMDPDEAVIYRKATDYCAGQEHCISEVIAKLKYWKAGAVLTSKIIAHLTEEGYIDEQRYAIAFARGKFRNLQWGKVKIRYELKAKRIREEVISQALDQLDEREYVQCILKLIEGKLKSLGGDTRENRLKTLRFLSGKGFELEWIGRLMREEIE